MAAVRLRVLRCRLSEQAEVPQARLLQHCLDIYSVRLHMLEARQLTNTMIQKDIQHIISRLR